MSEDAAEQGGFAWSGALADQIDWHWTSHARPRLDGLTDEEYRWEPAPGAWSVRPRGSGPGHGVMEVGPGAGVIDFALPEPVPAPVTTIAWRLCHVIVGVLGERNARYFVGAATSYDTYDYPLRADAALADLDAGFARWATGVRGLTEADLVARCGEPGHEDASMVELVLHINRELIHHLAEVALLRDLWAHRST